MSLAKKLTINFIKLFIIYLFIGLVYMVYALNDKLDKYDVKNEKYNGNIEISYNEVSNNFVSSKNNNSIQNYINCYEYPIKEENFTNEMNQKLNEIYELFKNQNYTVSFAYEDIYSGLHISYNENQLYFSASAIKAPVALYLYKQAEEGKIDLNTYMEYTQNFFVEGSGNLQYAEIGSSYTLKNLTYKTIVESDNIAYQMISSKADPLGVKKYWKEKGATDFWNYSIWGNITAHDGVIYMKDLYEYSTNNTDLSNELMNYFYNSVSPQISSPKNNKIAHKSGWRADTIYDTAVIYDEYPYVVAIMTNMGFGDYHTFYSNASKLIEEFHDIYWQAKANYCYNEAF